MAATIHRLVTILGLVLVLGTDFLATATAAAPEPAKPANPFRGKILHVTCSDSHASYSAVLELAEVLDLGKRSFLRGRYVADKSFTQVTPGKITWISLDRIVQILEFEDLDDIRNTYKNTENQSIPSSPSRSFGEM